MIVGHRLRAGAVALALIPVAGAAQAQSVTGAPVTAAPLLGTELLGGPPAGNRAARTYDAPRRYDASPRYDDTAQAAPAQAAPAQPAPEAATPAPAAPARSMSLLGDPSEDPAFLTFGAGVFDFHRSTKAAEFAVSYRSNQRWWIFKPHAGILGTSKGGVYGWWGLLVDVYLGQNWVVTPSTSIGAYGRGSGKDLGSALEFRSGLELAYRFENKSRVGFGVYHLSNASTGRKNPGEESLLVYYAMPIRAILDHDIFKK